MSKRKSKPLIVITCPDLKSNFNVRKLIEKQEELRSDYHFIITAGNVSTIEFKEFGLIYANNSNLRKVEEELKKIIHQNNVDV